MEFSVIQVSSALDMVTFAMSQCRCRAQTYLACEIRISFDHITSWFRPWSRVALVRTLQLVKSEMTGEGGHGGYPRAIANGIRVRRMNELVKCSVEYKGHRVISVSKAVVMCSRRPTSWSLLNIRPTVADVPTSYLTATFRRSFQSQSFESRPRFHASSA